MKASAHDPARLDVAAFARARGRLEGRTPLSDLRRLAESLVCPADGSGQPVEWTAVGTWTERVGRPPEPRIALRASARVWQTCQRCLQPAVEDLVVDNSFFFVDGEEEAARLDEEGDEDVLALPRALKLLDLLEDELILALPIVPRHTVCPDPLAYDPGVAAAEDSAQTEAPAHPFAALAGLKRGGKPPG